MAGARHIISRVRLRGDAPDPNTVEKDPEPARKSLLAGNAPVILANIFNVNQNMLALEFMQHGDIHHWLNKLGDRKIRLKSEDMWKIFHCREYSSLLAHASIIF